MNFIDYFFILIVLLAIWRGWQRGFIDGLLGLVIVVGSALAAYFFYPWLAAFIKARTDWFGAFLFPASFIILYALTWFLLTVISNAIIRSLPDGTHAHGVNRLLGIVPGFINGLFTAVIAAALLLAFPLSDGFSEQARNSRLANRLIVPAEWLEERLSPVFDESVERTLNRLTIKPGSDILVELPFKVTNAKIRVDLEARMLQMVNEERQKAGLDTLRADPEIAVVARAHSADMFARGYFSHVTPEGKNPFDRMRAAGIKFRSAGENLALGQTLYIAHNGLMNSPGHRANILHPAFGRLGIGILDGGVRGLMITQHFRN